MREDDLRKKWEPMTRGLGLSAAEEAELASDLEKAHNEIGSGDPPQGVEKILPGVVDSYMERRAAKSKAGQSSVAAAIRGSFPDRWNVREQAAKAVESGSLKSVEDVLEVVLSLVASLPPEEVRGSVPGGTDREFKVSVESAGGVVLVKWWTTIDASDVTEREFTDREYALLQRFFDDRRAAEENKRGSRTNP